jgi:hypothetical protein
MTTPHWPRPQWSDSGSRALYVWFLFGEFAEDLSVDARRYRTRGAPDGVDVMRYTHDALRGWEGYPLGAAMGDVLKNDSAATFERALAMRDVIMVRGEIADPADLDPLRDLIGLVTALVDTGGVAIVDPQILSIFDPAAWHARFFASDTFTSRDHVVILASDDETSPGRQWVHTRGMRKFARRDIGIRNVMPEHAGHAGHLAQRFVDFQALGGIVEDGREIEVEGLPSNMRVEYAGSLEDPEFNNVHLAIRWPD